MSELEGKIRALIAQEGPIAFSRFMRMALYDAEHGYYRRDVFGRAGDFYTASQLQPVFGAYVATLAAQLAPGHEAFVDIGAGRGEMAGAFAHVEYRAVEQGQKLPKTNYAVLFSNELIDAMPVDLIDDEGRLLRVAHDGARFRWHPHEPAQGTVEVRDEEVRAHLVEAYESLERGVYILIDYGYRARERELRFGSGSLMSYRKHVASEDVLLTPGERDITAHVDWDRTLEMAREAGWMVKSLERLSASMLALGPDVLEGLNLLGEMQLKTLLFGMGESFDVVVLEKK